jgi:hypothetical protein
LEDAILDEGGLVKGALRVPFFAPVSALSASLAFVLAFHGGHEVSRHVAVAPWLALLLLLFVPVLGRIARRALGPRGPVAGALAAAFVAPMIVLGCLSELSDPLIRGFFLPCGTPRAMLEMSVPPAMFAAGLMGGLLAVPLAVRAGAGLHRVAVALAAIGALLAGASIFRARFTETDRYADTLTFVDAVRATAGTPSIRGSAPVSHREPHAADVARGPVEVYDDDLGGAVLRRACSEHRCQVTLVPPGTPVEEASYTSWDTTDDALIPVHRDPLRDVWVVGGHGWRRSSRAGFVRGDIFVHDVASSLSPPRGWIAGALAGLAFAALLLALRRRRALHHAAVAAGREGTLEASGQIVLPGGEPPLRAAPGQALAVGPVVILGGEGSPRGLYRGDALAAGARVVCGARADLLDAAEGRMAALDALALAALALTVAPLLASAVVGLLP